MVLFDTNILVYANDNRDPRKQDIAMRLLERHARSRDGMVAMQTLHEFANVLLNKLHREPADIAGRIRVYSSVFGVIDSSVAKLTRALEIHAFCKISIWDALIVAAAEAGGCDTILSEDLNDGQRYCGILAQNPFAVK